MATTTIKDQTINYLDKDFTDFKNSLLSFAQSYFPNTYTDFSDADPGMMFIEMSSYVGDVVGFYLDNQIQENILLQTREQNNIIQTSYAFGYRPKMSYSSVLDVDIYQVIAATSSISGSVPNYNFSIIVGEYTSLTSVNGVNFLTIEEARFDQASNPEVIFRDNNSFFLKQTVKAISATIKTASFDFTTPQKFDSVIISDTNILGILNAIDSNNQTWYEVPYLAESKIIIRNNNPNYNNDGIPYLLQYQEVPNRYTTRFTDNLTLNLYFGAGVSNISDSNLFPNMNDLSLGNDLVPVTYFQGTYNKAKGLFSKQYGLAPSNIVLNVQYLVGGGISSNISSQQITSIDTSNIVFVPTDPYQSVLVNNPSGSSGGRSGDTVEEIRQNAMNAYQAQNRSVTKDDYVLRALSMPTDFGTMAKAIAIQDAKISNNSGVGDSLLNSNPLALSLYVLSYDSSGSLTQANDTLKQNLSTYLEGYRMATDAINIKDAFIVNIGVNFSITTNPGYNNSTVLTNCMIALQSYFSTDQWNINQTIVISDINFNLLKVKGVQSVPSIEIINLQGGNYSPYGYDIQAATQKNIIYPSIDPCIFEVKFPNIDISGRVLTA
jgi:hypothetical protein